MSPPPEIFRALAARGLLAPEPVPLRLPGGNRDRRPVLARSSWKAHATDGAPLKLTIGPHLGTLDARHREAQKACPDLVPPWVFTESIDGYAVVAERFIEGVTIDTPDDDGTADPVRFRAGLQRIRTLLASTELPSTAAARTNEWRRWTTRLLASGAFTLPETTCLTEQVLPPLFARIARGRATTRWSGGDFRTGNILLDTHGRPWLIDHEHGIRTHFFVEDEVRFHIFTPEARHQPDLLPSVAAHDVAWHLFFWLRQFLLEVENNTTGYLGRFRAQRKALIRRLAEDVAGGSLDGWSVPALPVDFALEDVRWLQHEELILFVSGWAHLPGNGTLEGFSLSHYGRPPARLLPTARADVQRHFAGPPVTRVSGFSGRQTAADPETRFTLTATTGEGWLLPLRTFRAAEAVGRGPSTGHYAHWAQRHDPDPPASNVPQGPLFSILLPVYNTPPAFLEACLASVQAQHYKHWELIIVDDGSTTPEVGPALARAASDPRATVIVRPRNGGIARATNDALDRASGEFVVLLDHDDLFRPHTLASLAGVVAEDPAVDVIYSDEDKITEDGRRIIPFLKPAFSPEFLRGVMYPGHALCVRRTLARDAGGFDSSYDGVQDYEFFLRISELTERIRHLPAFLYHWRRSAGSSAMHGNVKGDMDARQLAAVRAHLSRIGDPREAEAAGGHRIRLSAPADAAPPPTDAISFKSDDDPLAVLAAAAIASRADVLILVPAPLPSGDKSWQTELSALALRPDSGFVAPVFLSDEDRILESGCTFADGKLVPLMVNFDPDDDGYNGATLCNREVAAVSPLCVAVRRQLVVDHVPAAGEGWVEFTERLRKAGLHHRVCTSARLRLDRSAANHRHAIPAPAGAVDPYYNPTFRRSPADYAFVGANLPPVGDGKIVFHLDRSPPSSLDDGCLIVRGWCFHERAEPVRIQIEAGPITWTVAATDPRPDVAAAFRRIEATKSGFAIHLRLPAGRHSCTVTAVTQNKVCTTLFQGFVSVPLKAALNRSRSSDPATLLACQLVVAPLRTPRTLTRGSHSGRTAPPPGWPRFSIVTPSFQQAPFLGETLRGVLNQAVEGHYVVQDGGSTDGSTSLIERAAARQPASMALSWESLPDFGQTDAIARGFAKTRGGPDDVMAWINSDDFHLPGALGIVADYFARHPQVDVVYGHRLLVNERSEEIGRWHLPPHDSEVLRLYDFVPQETLFWRRRIWEKVGGVNPDFQFAMDWDLLLRFQAAGARIVRLPRFLACFRVHAAQKTSAQLGTVGQEELDTLRHRTFGRFVPAAEMIAHPRLQAYLRASARLDLLARVGYRGRAG